MSNDSDRREPKPPPAGDAVAPEDLLAYAASRLAMPALGLACCGLAGAVLTAFGLAVQTVVFVFGEAGLSIGWLPFVPNATAVSLGLQVGGIVLNGVLVLGAACMRKLKHHAFARVVAVLATIPYGCLCTVPTCVPLWLGNCVLGIWAFTALSDPFVRAAFAQRKKPDA